MACGEPVTRESWQMPGNACCNTACAMKYNSIKLSKLNRKLNPGRMIPETKKKLREAHLGKGEGKSYEKTYSRHTHRIVAEEMLGRPLKKGEVVHHKNHNKRDNRPENLQIFSSQAEHFKWHLNEKFGKPNE